MNQEKSLVQSISTKDNEDSIQIDINDKPKMSHSKSIVHEVFAKLCPTRNVTVFKDRAEVNRVVKVDVEEGDTEILMRQLPSIVQKDSVRVTCYTESVTIVEVAFQIKSVVENSCNKNEENLKVESESEKILKRLKILKKEKTVLLEKLKRNEKEVSILDSYANCITEKKEDKVGEILDKKSIESLLHFLSIYKDRNEKITDSTISLNENMESINKEIDALTDNLNRLQPPTKKYREESCVSILLNVQKNTNVNLVVSYVVHPFASWTPFYDVRAFSADNSVQILYFANVCQSTGEDWNDCKITLSTALPSVGGSPPQLLPYTLDLKEHVKIPKKSLSKSSFRSSFIKASHLENIEQDRMLGDVSDYLINPLIMPGSMPVAKALDGMTSTSFELKLFSPCVIRQGIKLTMEPVRVVILSFMFGWALAVTELNDNNFFEYAKRKEVLLVDFYTPWCSDCKRLAPEFEGAAAQLQDRSADLVKVDCEGAGKGLCQMYQIRSWPQLKNFHFGTFTGDYTGPQSAEAIASYINTVEQSSSSFAPGYYQNVGYASAPKDSLVEPAPPVVGALSCARCSIGRATKCTKVVKKACVELQLREKAKKEEAKQNDDDKKRSVLVKKADTKKKQ